MAALKQLEQEVIQLERVQHPLAVLFRAIWDRLEAAESRAGLSEEAMQRLAYEAASVSLAEVRKLRRELRGWWWWMLIALAFGVLVGWLAH